MSEYLVMPSRRRLPVVSFMRVLRFQHELLREYQFEQPAPGRLVASVVPLSPSYGPEQAADLERALRDFLGEPLEVEVRIVEKIPRGPSGKRPILKPLPDHFPRWGGGSVRPAGPCRRPRSYDAAPSVLVHPIVSRADGWGMCSRNRR